MVADDRIESLEERLMVLRDKVAREGFAVPDDVLDYIAEKFALPQTLKGALINVQAYASRRGIPVDMAMARLVLDGVRPGAVVETTPEGTGESAIETAVDTDAEEAVSSAGEPVTAPQEPELFDGEESAFVAEAPPIEDVVASLFEAEAPVEHEMYPEPEPYPAQESFLDLESHPEPEVRPAPASVPAVVPAPPVVPAPAPAAVPASAPPFLGGPAAQPAPAYASASVQQPAPASVVWFAPMRSVKKQSLVTRVGILLERAGLSSAVAEGDLVAVKLHFGEEGCTGFVQPVFLREVVSRVRSKGGKPFLTDANTLYRGQRSNAVDHLACAVHNGFTYATVEAPLIIADGLDGRDAVDVPISGYKHFDSVRLGAAAVHADAMVVVTHVKGHEAVGFGGALKNVGMGLGCRSAKQRMHSDFEPNPDAEKCTGCGRCAKWCPVNAIEIIDGCAVVDHELCYGCGECVAACPYGAISISWKTTPEAIQEKIVEHVAGAVAEKEGKVIYLSFVTDVSPDCDCWHFSDASIVSDIGVLASTDPVAIDQAAYDLVVKAVGLPGSRGEGMSAGDDKFKTVTGVDGTVAIHYAEEHGLGTRRYELKTLD